jgi:hypothetical protein
MQCLGQSVTGLTPREHRFSPRTVRRGFVVGKVVVGYFSEYVSFSFLSLHPPKLHIHSLVCHRHCDLSN